MLTVNGAAVQKVILNDTQVNYIVKDGKLVWADPGIYLQSSGTQYFDTGVYGTGDMTFDILFALLDVGAHGIFGGRTDYAQNGFMLHHLATGLRFDYGTELKFIPFTQSKTRVSSRVEGNSYVVSSSGQGDVLFTKQTFTTTKTLPLFRINSSNGATTNGSLKLYFLKLKNANGELVRHFVPVPAGLVIGNFTVPSNGMFDLVHQQFYANQGSGSFTIGGDQ